MAIRLHVTRHIEKEKKEPIKLKIERVVSVPKKVKKLPKKTPVVKKEIKPKKIVTPKKAVKKVVKKSVLKNKEVVETPVEIIPNIEIVEIIDSTEVVIIPSKDTDSDNNIELSKDDNIVDIN